MIIRWNGGWKCEVCRLSLIEILATCITGIVKIHFAQLYIMYSFYYEFLVIGVRYVSVRHCMLWRGISIVRSRGSKSFLWRIWYISIPDNVINYICHIPCLIHIRYNDIHGLIETIEVKTKASRRRKRLHWYI